MSTRIQRATSADADFVVLAQKLTEFLAAHNGERNEFYVQFNKIDTIPNAVVAYVDGNPVGCGAFRPVDDQTVEIKRMFVAPTVRGRGIGQAILGELEAWAVQEGAHTAVLETSKRLDSAVRLYQRSGYVVIPNYGPYVDAGDSVCMEKELDNQKPLTTGYGKTPS
jgi:GNAT superfamily N-acetyltransferase